jgi:predicted nucleic acid-binding protein
LETLLKIIKIYVDTCGWCRPWDDPRVARNAAEAIAIATVIESAQIAGHPIVGSMVVMNELKKNKNDASRRAVLDYYAGAVNETVVLSEKDSARAQSLQAVGVGVMDSMHLSAAESAGASYLLTVDDDFINIVAKKNLSKVNVINPLTYLAGGAI